MNATVVEYAVPLADPLETAAGTVERRAGALFVVTDGEVTGVGDAAPLPGWTEEYDACTAALSTARDRLEAGWEAALSAAEGRPAARHAVTLARADLAARRAERPLYRQLGGDRTRSVPVNATIGDAPRPATAARAREAVEAGFGTLKVKVGARDRVDDAGRLRAVREAVGDGVAVRADANAAWDRETARGALASFEAAGVAYVEQPLAPDDLAGHAALRGGDVGVAVDETLASVTVEETLRAGAADVLVVKPMVVGGIDRAREAARRARAAGVTPVVTTTVDAAVARTAAVHLAASLEALPACGLATADRLATDIAPDPAPVDDGRIVVPQTPGTGVAVEELV